MSKPLTSGIYRIRQDVCGPLGSARVERVEDSRPSHERYTVRFYAREAPTGELVTTCWRWGVPDSATERELGGLHLDGGWTRALAIAEDCVNGEG